MHKPVVVIAIFLPALAGCHGNRLPPETDPAQGREVLKAVLDAWAQGSSAADLKHARPAIVAYDPDWETGYKLASYQIAPADRRIGVDLLLTVTLSLTRGEAKPMTKTVNFSIAIGSQTAVLRQT